MTAALASKPLALSLGDQLAQDFTFAVSEAFGKTFDVPVKAGRYVIGEGSVSLTGDVYGVVGFIQEKLEGTLTACFNITVMNKILPRLLGDGIEITQDVAMDAVGEITNMIFGQIKTALNQRGHHLRFGMPSVILGGGHFISQMHEGRYMLMHFELEGSVFQIHVALHGSMK
ncbi:MAG: chemotaxis protein CheX [Alphaproteobacteria bacterium]|nr:chemotaxis protein CheX [Alphaproteobacteria bacterium]